MADCEKYKKITFSGKQVFTKKERKKFHFPVAIPEKIGYNTSAWVCARDILKTTHPGIAFPSALLGGQRGMIGVEEKQKEK